MTVPRSPDAIEPEQATAIFAELALAGDLALQFPADGCYARTHVMVQRLVDRGLVPSKVWAFAASTTDLLWTETPDHADGRAQWWYHVAPVLLVRRPVGDAQEMVIDYSPGSRRRVAQRAPRHADAGSNDSWGTAAASTRGLGILARSRSS